MMLVWYHASYHAQWFLKTSLATDFISCEHNEMASMNTEGQTFSGATQEKSPTKRWS